MQGWGPTWMTSDVQRRGSKLSQGLRAGFPEEGRQTNYRRRELTTGSH